MQKLWAERVVYALRGWFRSETPVWPENLAAGQNDAQMVVRHCIDSRMVPAKLLHLAPGEAFDSAAAGALVPQWNGGRGRSVQTAIDIGYPVAHFEKVDTVFIKGHTHCGAVGALFAMVRSDMSKHDAGANGSWLLPMVDRDKTALRVIRETQDVKSDATLRWLEQYLVLKSMSHLHSYVFGGQNVAGMIASGELIVLGGIRGLDKSQHGDYPLSVFDPSGCSFVELGQVYDAARQPDLALMEKAGSWQAYLVEKPGSGLVMARGASVEEVGRIRGEDIVRADMRHCLNVAREEGLALTR